MYIHLEDVGVSMPGRFVSLWPKLSLAVPREHSCPHFVFFKEIDLLSERTADSAQRGPKCLVATA